MRGFNLQEIKDFGPRAQVEGLEGEGSQPLPEGALWLLLTGEFPTAEQLKNLSAEIKSRSVLPASVQDYIKGLPKGMRPLTQFSTALLHFQAESQFNKRLDDQVQRDNLWEAIYEDALDIIAKTPLIAAYIYRNNLKVLLNFS